ncbi:MAG: type II toxin-antitoxin system HicB family antitoxin [Chloroflexota bacterium]|nr:type II toxin-antitoxin system HicB family antitoxin [Chloroflexota bacterium]MDE2948729.1 type II toxin-antitoxin system HicB family antitoxin [Chloroflexota bacterium]
MDQELLDQAIALAARGYQVAVQREDDENGNLVWGAFVPEMPSCFAQGETVESAIEALNTVREDYIYFLMKHGVPVPEPTPRAPVGDDSSTERAGAEVTSSN